MENLIDAQDQGQTFLSIYIPLTDLLIDVLSDGAMNHGYIRALETLTVLRRTYLG